MKTNFTPGPWQSAGQMLTVSTGHNVSYVTKKTEIIAQCWEPVDFAGQDTKQQTLANAALIAAAPDLFEALEVIIRELSQHPEFDMGNSKVHYCVHKALAAIAKAKGELC